MKQAANCTERRRFLKRCTFLSLHAIVSVLLAINSASGQQRNSPPEPRDIELHANEKSVIVRPIDQLVEFEQAAISNNPNIASLNSRIQQLRFARQRAGIYPDVQIGFSAQEVGIEGAAGQMGAFVNQTLVRGGKLELDQSIIGHEIERMQQRVAIQQLRIQTEVRIAFYDAAIGQRRIKLQDRLVKDHRTREGFVKRLVDVGELPSSELLYARRRFDKAIVARNAVRSRQTLVWRRLATLVNDPGLRQIELRIDLEDFGKELQWDASLEQILATSPVIAERMKRIDEQNCAIARACAERYQDVSASLGVFHDHASSDEFVAVQASIPISRKPRIQTLVAEQRAKLAEFENDVQAIRMRITNEFAEEFSRYKVAFETATTYVNEILPRHNETQAIALKAFRFKEISRLDLVIAEIAFLEAQSNYLDELELFWRSKHRIDGFLLDRNTSFLDE